MNGTFIFGLALLIAALPGQAEERDPHDGILKLRQLVLSEFRVKPGWLSEAMDKLRASWFAVYPDQSFPVILMEPEDHRGSMPMNLDLKEVTSYEAVEAAAMLNGMSHVMRLDMLHLRTLFSLDGDVYTWSPRIPASVCKSLGLPTGASADKSTNAQALNRLKELGITFEEGMHASWLMDNMFQIRNQDTEIMKLTELIKYAEDGYIVKKLPRPSPP